MSWAAFSALPALERELWLEKQDRKANRCGRCSNDRDVCSHEDQVWYPQRTICYAEMEAQAANRRYDELHEHAPFHDGTFTEWSDKPSKATPYHYRDGVSVWVAPVDLSPNDRFLSDHRAPGKPRGGEHGNEA